MPSASSSARTRRSRMAVLPSLRELPLNATTFIFVRSFSCRPSGDVERAGQVRHVALRLARRAGDPRQREGEHAAPEGAHEIVVEAVAALVLPAERVLEHLVERALVHEDEDAWAQPHDQAVDALPAVHVLALGRLLAERSRPLADVGHAESVVQQQVVGELALSGAQHADLVEAFPQPLAHATHEVVARLDARRRRRLAHEEHAQRPAWRHDVGERRDAAALDLQLGAVVHGAPHAPPRRATTSWVAWARGCGCLLYTSPSPRDRTRSRM